MSVTEVKEFNPLVGKVSKALVPMLKLSVVDLASKEKAFEALQVVKGYKQEIEKVRDALVRPKNEFVKLVNAKAKEILGPLDDAQSKLNKLLVNYDAQVRRDQEEELARIAREKKKNEAEALAKLHNAHDEAPDRITLAMQEAQIKAEAQAKHDELNDQRDELKTETVKGLRDNWKFKIVDRNAISDDFMMPDEVAIGKLVRAMGEKATKVVGGIEVWNDPQVASGAVAPKGRLK